MIGKIEQLTKSKSGKAWRVLVDNRWFGAQFDSKIDSIPVGSMIDFDFNSDAKYGDWITTWGPAVGGAATTTPAKPVGELIRVPEQSSKANGDSRSNDRWWLPFVSNQCAHAIAAGKIQGVADLRSWALAAKLAILNADCDSDEPF